VAGNTGVFLFTDRLQYLARQYSELTVKALWSTCLRGEALLWHSAELTDMERDLLADSSVEGIARQLTKRFQDRPEIALAALTTMADLCSGKSIRGFVQRIFRYSRSIGQDSTFKNLIHAWNALDPRSNLTSNVQHPKRPRVAGNHPLYRRVRARTYEVLYIVALV
jgi:hypothetical protein